MQSVVVYGRKDCEYSVAAKELLRRHGVAFKEIEVDGDADRLSEMIRRAGGRHTTPQIFIEGRHVGGYDDLRSLADQGGLDGSADATAS
jgi:glutaredoxin 3